MVDAGDQKLERMKQIMYKAIKQHSTKPINEILSKGFDVNTPIMPMGINSLHLCAAVGNPSCLEVILAANPSAEITDQLGRNCLHFACKAGNTENFKVLYAKWGEDEDLNLLDSQSEAGMTPLMLAIQSVEPELVVECLNNQANPFLLDGFGKRALDYTIHLQSVESRTG